MTARVLESVFVPHYDEHSTPSHDADSGAASLAHIQTPEHGSKPLFLADSSPWHRDEARAVLQNLSNFIALGCLVGQTLLDDHGDTQAWTELFHIALRGLGALQYTLNDLISAGWIRVFAHSRKLGSEAVVLRIYALAADVGHRFINRADKQSRIRLEKLRAVVAALDTSSELWSGAANGHSRVSFDMWATPDMHSLFWIFNNIPSPAPEIVGDHFRKQALHDILDPHSQLRGLVSRLYPYQKRSAALMLQRESESRIYLDPRLEERTAPDGSLFYYCPRDFHFLRHPRRYEAGKGGILAETMGLGKTVICLALIISTRGMLAKVPIEHARSERYPSARSLKSACVTAAHKHGIPWKPYFEDYEAETGDSVQTCIDQLESSSYSYSIPRPPPRLNRVTSIPPPDVKIMAATTIVVVPRNLLSQWEAELTKHVKPGVLSILVMDDPKKPLPKPLELRKYDLVLFARGRFEQENRDGTDEAGRRFSKTPLSCVCPYIKATRIRDCTCLRPEDLYDSPLKKLHFLRIIIDEGHSFSTTTSIASTVASKLITADHRWVVSGTPAKDLLGVEMDLYSSDQLPMTLHNEEERSVILNQRKNFNASEDTQGAVKSIGSLLGHFLQIQPWCEDPTSWDEYIYRHEAAKKKTHSAFSSALRQSLEAIVIKTRPEDVERDIDLPPLTHNIVKLDPSFHDKITANLFTLVLKANSITSERKDKDYLFHKDGVAARRQLVNNLRQSAFTWTGFSKADVEATIGNCQRYLAKEDVKCSDEDREMLLRCIREAEYTLTLDCWNGIRSTHELGLYIKDWPEDSAEHWTFAGTNPVLTGASQVAEAQHYVHDNLLKNKDSALSGEGIRALARARARGLAEDNTAAKNPKSSLVSTGVPGSGLGGEPVKKHSPPRVKARKNSLDVNVDKMPEPDDETEKMQAGPPRKKRKLSTSSVTSPPAEDSLPAPCIPPDDPLLAARLIGTASAKASYLLSQILEHSPTEKILVFYTGDNAAYYLAQCLDVLHVPHLIYARSLPAALKSSHVVAFNSDPKWRVMLMDAGQAAFGLNLSAASRVYFVNPVCRPAVEAQAVKRAHRIGQRREVRVETLVLRGAVEEGMWERARRMSREEHGRVKAIEDDVGVREVIESADLVAFGEGEREGRGMARVALLAGRGERVWGRQGWWDWFVEWTEEAKGKKGKD